MNFFGFSLLMLSICIILGQSKPAQHKPHALPKKCIDAHDCKTGYTCIFIKKLGFKLCARSKHNLGPQEGGPVQGGSFRSAKKSIKQSKLPPSAWLSTPLSAPPVAESALPVAEELSSGSGPPTLNEDIEGKDYLEEDESNGALKGVAPPSPKTEDDYLEDDFLEDAEYEPDDTDDDQEFPEEDNSVPEFPEEERDPKGEELEIQENGNIFFISSMVPN